MTSFIDDVAICANCGKFADQHRLGSIHAWSAPDLDARPGEFARSYMDLWLQECKSCGYVASNLGADMDPRTRALLKSPQWSELERAMKACGRLVGRFLRCSAMMENIGALEVAANTALWAAWASDDRRETATAILSRQRAAEFFKRTLADNKVKAENVAGVQLVLIDVLRRTGQWDEALARCRDFDWRNRDKNKDQEFQIMTAVLLFEQHLCESHDDRCYNTNAALDFAADRLPPVEMEKPRTNAKTAVSGTREVSELLTRKQFLATVKEFSARYGEHKWST